MILYSLKCANGHLFDSWFRSLSDFEALSGAGQLVCPNCGEASVTKAPMAPAVFGARPDAPPSGAAGTEAPLAQQNAPSAEQIERAIAALRKQVEETSDYVGLSFAAEARRIHAGDAPERPIYGETRPDEARKLIEDGIPVAPLPFVPRRKVS